MFDKYVDKKLKLLRQFHRTATADDIIFLKNCNSYAEIDTYFKKIIYNESR